jgi:hypothetical protein
MEVNGKGGAANDIVVILVVITKFLVNSEPYMQNAVIGKQIKLGTYIGVRGSTGCIDNRVEIFSVQQIFGLCIPFDNFDETISTTVTTVSSLNDIGWRAAGESGSQREERQYFERLHE